MAKSELQNYIDKTLTTVGSLAIEATKEVIDRDANACFENIKSGTPVNTGALQQSLAIERKDDNPNKYGYSIDYEGYNEDGVAYSYIGRSLNKGTSKIQATKHIDKAVRKLKGLDARIEQTFLNKLEKIDK